MAGHFSQLFLLEMMQSRCCREMHHAISQILILYCLLTCTSVYYIGCNFLSNVISPNSVPVLVRALTLKIQETKSQVLFRLKYHNPMDGGISISSVTGTNLLILDERRQYLLYPANQTPTGSVRVSMCVFQALIYIHSPCTES